MSSYKDIKNFRNRLKERMVYVMGGCCQCCGYNNTNTALEFHHLNSEEKLFGISDNANRSWATVRLELQKCIMVCANCHREIHAGLIDDSLLQSSFSEEKAKEVDDIVESLKQKTLFVCKDCGVEVSKNHYYCTKCAAKRKQMVIRPNRDELKTLIRTKSFTEIGKQFKGSDNAIRKWCKAEGLPSKKQDIKLYTDEEWKFI